MGLGRADAGAGQIYYRLTFENTSEAPCTLRGLPGVSLIARGGGVIGAPAEREGATRAQTVIGPGKTADVTLHTLNRGIDDSACWDPPDHLRVYPPGSTEALTLRAPELRICGDRFTTTVVADDRPGRAGTAARGAGRFVDRGSLRKLPDSRFTTRV
ncbi:DUF4232 domain-containing protein [Streptomyces clavifer]|uniref:DUF4232 domain-containing protein n=1 Tax=Streptomyces clavifer TaxID=68188 RepID=UPI00364D614A